MKNSTKILLLLFLFLLKTTSYGWDARGHMLIAEIANAHLNLTTRYHIYQWLYAVGDGPRWRKFSQAAVWPDAIKSRGVHEFDRWHYIDLPYQQGQGLVKPVHQENAVWAIDKCLQVLRDNSRTNAEKGIFLRLLIHIIADIHQPMHCVSRYSEDFPEGDRGGNAFKLKHRTAHNLHQLWDNMLSMHMPRRVKIAQWALLLQIRYPKYSFQAELQQQDPAEWARSCHELATKEAYEGIAPYSKPRATYLKNAARLAERQAVLAGYRIAAVLNGL